METKVNGNKHVENTVENTSLLLQEELNPEINNDLTNDFDLILEKMPALSTMQNNLKSLKKRQAIPTKNQAYQQFDKLKMYIDLGLYYKIIKFNFNLSESNLFKSDTPEKPETYLEWQNRIYKNKKVIEKADDIKLKENEYKIYIEELEENKYAENEFWEENENSRKKYRYPNCKISYKNSPLGLINVYIKNDLLFIYLTGKFTWNNGQINYISKNNIKEVLKNVCLYSNIRFDVEQFILHAGVYLCDVCIDIRLEKVEKYINAISSFLPLDSNRYRNMKFGSHGLKIKSNAKNAGSSLTIYNKEKEILNSVNKSERLKEKLKDIIENPNSIKNILRLEVQMYKLQDIRALLNIPMKQERKVNLIDVLNSTAKPILARFKNFGVTEEILKEKIEGWIENNNKEKTEPNTSKQLVTMFAAERYAEIIKENNYDIRRTKSHIKTEYNIYNSALASNLTSVIKENFWNFLIYRKQKAIRLIIDLLDKIHIYYGRIPMEDTKCLVS